MPMTSHQLTTTVGVRDTKRKPGCIQSVFDGLIQFHSDFPPRNVAFTNFAPIWDGVLGLNPGYGAFGYVNTGPCNPGPSTKGNCGEPDHYYEWFWGHSSAVTHKIMAD